MAVMDNITIRSKIARKALASVLQKTIYKKFGADVQISFPETVSIAIDDDGAAHIFLGMEAVVDKKAVGSLLESL